VEADVEIKIVRKKGQPPQAEFDLYTRHANVKVVVGLDGYNYRHYTRDSEWYRSGTLGKNVHLAMNGPIMLSFNDMEDFLDKIRSGVAEAKEKLQDLT
jgi:hypothetical protein